MDHAPNLLPGHGNGCDAPASAAIPFARPWLDSRARSFVQAALDGGELAGGGRFTARCHMLLRAATADGAPLLTTSGTAALDMAMLLLDLHEGDEVIMPSWTFTSTANAVVLRGATPVFVDVEATTLNIDPACVAAAIGERTRAVVCVHYAGIACDMGALIDLCGQYGLPLVEDAAQAYGSSWRGRPLGGIGDLAAFSFHGTKNVSSGEGGALIVNRPDLVERAEILWEKGTSRLRYQRREVARYEWCDIGSSFLPSEFTAALLLAQLGSADDVNRRRAAAWACYDTLLREAGLDRWLQLPVQPDETEGNGHIYAVRTRDGLDRDQLIAALRTRGIDCRSHYRALHSAPAGRRFGRTVGTMRVTDAADASLLRLPLDALITPDEQRRVVAALCETVAS